MFDTKPTEQKMQAALDHFEAEMKKVRTGRAHPSMLDGLKVQAYGSLMPLNQVANVTAPEAQLLQITPFDPGQMQAIEGAIRSDQSLGLNPSDDGRVIRVPVPALTEERRHQIVKQASEKVEETKIQLRTIRQDVFKDAKRRKDAKELSEDDVKRIEKAIDHVISGYQDKLEAAFKAKEQEILTI
ncbi:MAG TPA: ribosome recycling factor [Candidatus Saccharimonadaceae bacterium]|nr:ribosome recycling factor [Candidatus Saccharimonadaceae bacterium]